MHDVHSQHIHKQQYNYIYICVYCRKGLGFILFLKHLSPRCGFIEAKTWIFDCEQTYLPSFSKKTRIWPSDLLEKTLSHLWLQSISTYIIIYIYIYIYIYTYKFMSSIRFWAVTCCFVLGEQDKSSWREVPQVFLLQDWWRDADCGGLQLGHEKEGSWMLVDYGGLGLDLGLDLGLSWTYKKT
jgi:hypothetical protein